MTDIGRASVMTAKSIMEPARNLPHFVAGTMSPYPVVVKVVCR